MSSARIIGVTGATGLLGGAWLAELLRRDPEIEVLALTRQVGAPRSAPALSCQEAQRVRWLSVDLGTRRTTAAIRSQIQGVNVAWWHFAAATTLSRDVGAADETWRVNVEGTRELLELTEAGATPFYHVSTAFVFGQAGFGAATEEETPLDRRRFRNPYERSKAEAEVSVRRQLGRGRRGAIFRPSIVVGQGSGLGNQFLDLCQRAVELAMRRGEGEIVLRLPSAAALNLVPLDWVVAALFTLAAKPTADHPCHSLVADAPTRLADLIAAAPCHAVRVRFAPDLRPAELPPASRLVDRLLEEFRDYFEFGEFERAVQPSRPADLPPAPRVSLDLSLPEPEAILDRPVESTR